MRIPRWTLILSVGVVIVAFASLGASLVAVQTARPSATPTPSASPLSPREAQLQTVLDDAQELSARQAALRELSRSAPDAGPLVRILRRLRREQPGGEPLRTEAIAALEGFPRDPAARELLVVLAFRRGGALGERTLALDVLARRPDLAQCRKPLRALSHDPEASVAERARALLERLPPEGGE